MNKTPKFALWGLNLEQKRLKMEEMAMFYVICVLINIVLVGCDFINGMFETGVVSAKVGYLCMLVVFILSGFTGTILLAGLFMINKIPAVAKLFDKKITLYKDDLWASFF